MAVGILKISQWGSQKPGHLLFSAAEVLQRKSGVPGAGAEPWTPQTPAQPLSWQYLVAVISGSHLLRGQPVFISGYNEPSPTSLQDLPCQEAVVRLGIISMGKQEKVGSGLPGGELRSPWGDLVCLEQHQGSVLLKGFPGCTSGKEPACRCRRHKRRRFVSWTGKIPCRRAWQPTPVFLPGGSPWTEEPGGLESTGSQRVGHSWATEHARMCFSKSKCWVHRFQQS